MFEMMQDVTPDKSHNTMFSGRDEGGSDNHTSGVVLLNITQEAKENITISNSSDFNPENKTKMGYLETDFPVAIESNNGNPPKVEINTAVTLNTTEAELVHSRHENITILEQNATGISISVTTNDGHNFTAVASQNVTKIAIISG